MLSTACSMSRSTCSAWFPPCVLCTLLNPASWLRCERAIMRNVFHTNTLLLCSRLYSSSMHDSGSMSSMMGTANSLSAGMSLRSAAVNPAIWSAGTLIWRRKPAVPPPAATAPPFPATLRRLMGGPAAPDDPPVSAPAAVLAPAGPGAASGSRGGRSKGGQPAFFQSTHSDSCASTCLTAAAKSAPQSSVLDMAAYTRVASSSAPSNLDPTGTLSFLPSFLTACSAAAHCTRNWRLKPASRSCSPNSRLDDRYLTLVAAAAVAAWPPSTAMAARPAGPPACCACALAANEWPALTVTLRRSSSSSTVPRSATSLPHTDCASASAGFLNTFCSPQNVAYSLASMGSPLLSTSSGATSSTGSTSPLFTVPCRLTPDLSPSG
mmetsp:Transcript_8407/g.20975  ORF Transcript_8407/g.20975 Transcript_8407/m.20975 type:complete len:379 (+) Transcript_8407:316-1452(+)